jgi:hypothetical protein
MTGMLVSRTEIVPCGMYPSPSDEDGQRSRTMKMKYQWGDLLRTRVETVLYPAGSLARVSEVDAVTGTYDIEFEDEGEHPTGDYATFPEAQVRSVHEE